MRKQLFFTLKGAPPPRDMDTVHQEWLVECIESATSSSLGEDI
jgi:hypothetical protein